MPSKAILTRRTGQGQDPPDQHLLPCQDEADSGAADEAAEHLAAEDLLATGADEEEDEEEQAEAGEASTEGSSRVRLPRSWVRALLHNREVKGLKLMVRGTVEMGTFVHAVEGEMLCSSTNPTKVCPPLSSCQLKLTPCSLVQVPYFNAPIYLSGAPSPAASSIVGKVDEILGPINEVYFTVKMAEGMVATSFKGGDKVYVGGDKVLPIERFLPKPPGEKGALMLLLLTVGQG